MASGNISLTFFFFFKDSSHLFFLKFIYLFIYLWLCWVFVSVRGLPLVAASGDHSSSRCAGLSLSRPLLLRSTGSRRARSVIVAHGPSCSAACGIFPYQGSNPCPLHWQADSQPLHHQGSPSLTFIFVSWQGGDEFSTFMSVLHRQGLHSCLWSFTWYIILDISCETVLLSQKNKNEVIEKNPC